MKRISTIIKELVELDHQLWVYDDKEIKSAIEEYERKNRKSSNSVIIDMIYDGLWSD